jgi:hypothetical protein
MDLEIYHGFAQPELGKPTHSLFELREYERKPEPERLQNCTGLKQQGGGDEKKFL